MRRQELSERAFDLPRGTAPTPTRGLVWLLLPVPLLLLAHELHQRGVPPFTSVRWDVDVDRGWMEVLGYGYLLLAACLLARPARSRPTAPVHTAWSLALVVLVLDDAVALHERGGGWLDRRVALPNLPGLRTQDVGELLVWAALGAAVALVLWSCHRTSPEAPRHDSRRLCALVGVLVLFAVGVDMLHIVVQAVTSSDVVELVVTCVEAGGELGAMAALLAYAGHVVRRRPAPVTRGHRA